MAQSDTQVTETIGDWQLVCKAEGQCVISQSVVQQQSGTPVAQVRILARPNPLAIVTFPLGVPLREGWRQSVDGGQVTLRPFDFCDVKGCHAIMPLQKSQIGAFRRGRWLELQIQDSRQKPVDLALSLIGFTKAFRRMQEGR